MRAMVRTMVAAVLLVAMWGVISLDGNAEQEGFNRGGIYVTLAVTAVYLGTSLPLVRRASVSGGSAAFVRWGGLAMLVAGQVLYFAIASVLARRVM